jgi:predicted O-methyltransferase YrrM
MSDDAGLRDRLDRYVADLFAPEDDLLRDLRDEMARRGFPDIAVSASQGALLGVLLAAVGARRVLEIGTLGGYSAIWMARALPAGGRLITLEVDPDRAAFAREFAARAGLDDRIDVRVGAAIESIRAMIDAGEAQFDACFIDADKENYPAYLDHAFELVRTGGLVLADNVFWNGRILDEDPPDEGTRAILEFNRRLATDERIRATLVPVRDGLAVGVVTSGT